MVRYPTCVICNLEFESKSQRGRAGKICSPFCFRLYHHDLKHKRRTETIEGTISQILGAAKKRAKSKNIDFSITTNDLNNLLNKQNNCCNITNIPFELSGSKSPWTISLDRIDNEKGYTLDNVQLVCWMYNNCKNKWSDKEVVTFAKALCAQ